MGRQAATGWAVPGRFCSSPGLRMPGLPAGAVHGHAPACCLLGPSSTRSHPPLPPAPPQIAPVVSAGSAQSRADVLVIVMSAVLVLTGLQWLSLRPKDPQRVELEGEPAAFYAPGLPRPLLAELQW